MSQFGPFQGDSSIPAWVPGLVSGCHILFLHGTETIAQFHGTVTPNEGAYVNVGGRNWVIARVHWTYHGEGYPPTVCAWLAPFDPVWLLTQLVERAVRR